MLSGQLNGNGRGLKWGCIASLLGRRAKAEGSFVIGVGKVLPRCQDRGNYKTMQRGKERCDFDSETLVMLKSQRTHSY